MKFLIDTNILIPIEPTSISDLGVNTDQASQFIKLCNSSGKEIFLHPAILYDLARDKNKNRRQLREKLIEKYSVLQAAPSSEILDEDIIPPAIKGSNDWVDNELLTALYQELIHYLVTEDIGIHKKAKKLGITEKVLFLSDAITLLKDFFDKSPPTPPAVEEKYVYELSSSDPIFTSLREDYPGFDKWLKKCKTSHRKSYIVQGRDQKITGISILKQEESLPDGRKGKVLKLCTFKVSENHGGNRIGELLLKPVFSYARSNDYDYIYFTVFPKQTQLIVFANDFGFQRIKNKNSDTEYALCKTLNYSMDDIKDLSPLEINTRYGPGITTFENNSSFIVPIQPKYVFSLFPEIGPRQKNLFTPPPKTMWQCYTKSIFMPCSD